MNGFIGEIRMFAGDFAPRGWAICGGQLLSINQWSALFTILGTTYGGNGQTNFGLPNLRGRLPMGTGQGLGPYSYSDGEQFGSPNVYLTASNIPQHSHEITGNVRMLSNTVSANAATPGGNYFANDGSAKYNTSGSGTMKPADVALSLGAAGGNVLPENRMPYLGINYVICLEGCYPSRP